MERFYEEERKTDAYGTGNRHNCLVGGVLMLMLIMIQQRTRTH